MTTMANRARLSVAAKASVWNAIWWMTYNPPASPAMAPETEKATSCSRVVLIAVAWALRGLSRTAMIARPVRLARKPFTSSSTTSSQARQK